MLVFTDGQSEKLHRMGFVGGYGIFSEFPVAVSMPVPLDMKQTINSAELLTAFQALHLHAHCPKVSICGDSEYVLLGAKGALEGKGVGGVLRTRFQCPPVGGPPQLSQ